MFSKLRAGERIVTGLSITPANTTILPNASVQYTASLIFSDSTTEDVTALAVWNVAGNATPDSAPGLVIAGSTEGAATVSASHETFTSTAATISVLSGIFVSPLGNDSTGTGEPGSPFATIEQAISTATAGTIVRIARGNYTTTLITLKEGVSLYGGYAEDWSYDIISNKAIISDISTSGGDNCCSLDAKAAIIGGSTITPATVIQDLEISGSSNPGMNLPVALNTDGGSPVIRRCVLTGGFGATRSIGIDLRNGGSPRLESSEIYGGSSFISIGVRIRGATTAIVTGCYITGGSGSFKNTGIDCSNSGGVSYLYNNIITSGSASTTSSSGIHSYYANNLIANNTIVVASSTGSATGIETSYSSRPYINNNIFLLNSGTTRYGIYEWSYTGNDPIEVRNNIFFNATVVYHDNNSSSDWNAADMDSFAFANGGTTASANMESSPLIEGANDYHLTVSSPAIGAGLNGIDRGWANFPLDPTGTYPVDFEGTSRPSAGGGSWSIGAYEY